MEHQYIIFVCDLFKSRGGVSDYTHNLANRLLAAGRLKYVITPYGRLGESDYEIRKADIPLFRGTSPFDKIWPAGKLYTLFYYLKYYATCYRLMQRLKQENATLIFTEYYIDKFDILIYMARTLRIRYMIVFHGLDLMMAKEGSFLHFEKNVRSAELVIYNSLATENLQKSLWNIPCKATHILYPGVDVTAIESIHMQRPVRTVYRNSADELVFSTVSHLGKRKGIDKAIRIVHAMHATRPGVKYFIGGSGPEREYLGNLVRELKAEDYIFFLGKIDDEAKFDLLRQSNVFLLPNYSLNNKDFEGFGISFIEASLCGNVVIGGAHGGAVEAVAHGKTGFLFNFDEESAMQNCINTLNDILNRPEQVAEIEAAGAEYVRQRYDWAVLGRQFLAAERVRDN